METRKSMVQLSYLEPHLHPLQFTHHFSIWIFLTGKEEKEFSIQAISQISRLRDMPKEHSHYRSTSFALQKKKKLQYDLNVHSLKQEET